MKKLDLETDLLELRKKPIPPELGAMKKLSDLTLINCPDEAFPEGLVLKQLELLTIDQGQLEQLPQDIDECVPKLGWLSLKSLPLQRLPASLARTELWEVTLTDMKALDWDQALGVLATCKKLHTLEVHNCDFSAGMPAFEQLSQVTHLSLISCPLPEVPARLAKMESLSNLWLQQCKLRTPLPDALVLKPSLKLVFYGLNPNARKEQARVNALRPKLKFTVG